jgi:hypothetical protein
LLGIAFKILTAPTPARPRGSPLHGVVPRIFPQTAACGRQRTSAGFRGCRPNRTAWGYSSDSDCMGLFLRFSTLSPDALHGVVSRAFPSLAQTPLHGVVPRILPKPCWRWRHKPTRATPPTHTLGDHKGRPDVGPASGQPPLLSLSCASLNVRSSSLTFLPFSGSLSRDARVKVGYPHICA